MRVSCSFLSVFPSNPGRVRPIDVHLVGDLRQRKKTRREKTKKQRVGWTCVSRRPTLSAGGIGREKERWVCECVPVLVPVQQQVAMAQDGCWVVFDGDGKEQRQQRELLSVRFSGPVLGSRVLERERRRSEGGVWFLLAGLHADERRRKKETAANAAVCVMIGPEKVASRRCEVAIAKELKEELLCTHRVA